MRSRKEDFIENSIFHIYNHSVAETDLFRDDDDYSYLLNKFKENYHPEEIEIYSYCLMPNHFHFCLKQNSEIPLYKIFNKFLTSYAMHFNAKYKRKGKLFASKLQHSLITNDNYLIQLCKYIHYNPVKAGIVSRAEEWSFSKYCNYVGRKEDNLFSIDLISTYPDEFKDYVVTLREYEKYLEESEFSKLLFD